MALVLAYEPGQTPLDPDEAAQLVPKHITNQGALNEWEQANIVSAVQWIRRQRNPEVLSDHFCRALHKKMLGRTWRWAGQYRLSDKNIGCPWAQVSVRVRQLMDNTAYQLAEDALVVDEVAARFHHQLVLVHPFPNGNGRHSRLMTDCLLRMRGGAPFTWGGGSLVAPGDTRRLYIDALRAADAGDIHPLLAFVRT